MKLDAMWIGDGVSWLKNDCALNSAEMMACGSCQRCHVWQMCRAVQGTSNAVRLTEGAMRTVAHHVAGPFAHESQIATRTAPLRCCDTGTVCLTDSRIQQHDAHFTRSTIALRRKRELAATASKHHCLLMSSSHHDCPS